jgi:16S rRNA (guanine1207-N2)-methyltransferase
MNMDESRPGPIPSVPGDPVLRLLASAPPGEGARALLLGIGCDRALMRAYAQRYRETFWHNAHQPDHDKAASDAGPGAHFLLGDFPCAERVPGAEAEEDCLPASRFPENHFDRIVVRLGRGTALVNSVLREAFRMLRPGGELLAAGANREGIKSFAKRADGHFGNGDLLALKSSCRLLRFRKQTEAPIDPVEDPRYYGSLTHRLGYPGGELAYATKPGVFAYRATDAGTALLARFLPDCTGRRVLDLGCGSGALSLAAFARGAAHVTATDNSAIAIACAARNFDLAGAPGETLCADLAEGAHGLFDFILSNPPFHAEGATDYSLPAKVVEAISRRLKPGGEAWLVANQFLDYAGPARHRFQAVSALARENGYLIHHMVMPP